MNVYTLASPIAVVPDPDTPFLWLKSFTVFPPVWIPTNGVPDVLLTLSKLPSSNGTRAVFTVWVSLGFCTSKIVDAGILISYPRTYAVPGETL